jgi:hypothetical protein
MGKVAKLVDSPQQGAVFHRPSPEMAKFNTALRQVMRVSKGDLNRLLEVDKETPLVPQKRGRKPKISALAPASHDRG